jgi:hypothetical protein
MRADQAIFNRWKLARGLAIPLLLSIDGLL